MIGLLLPAPAPALSKHVFTTTIAGSGTSALSNPTALAVDESTGDLYVANTPVNERQRVDVDATGGTYALSFEGRSTTIAGTGNITAGTSVISDPHATTNFAVGEAISAAGVPAGAEIVDITNSGDLVLSVNATTTATQVPILASLPFDARSETLQRALFALSNVEIGNLSVSGPNGGPYSVEFTEALGGTDQPLLVADASGLTGGTASVQITTPRSGSSDAWIEKFTASGEFILMFGGGVDKTTGGDLCTAASHDECQPGSAGSSPGTFTDPQYLAVDNSGGPSAGDVYVGDARTGPGSGDVQKFDSQGELLTSWAQGGLLDGSEDPDSYSFSGTGQVAGLRGVAVDLAGNLFVSASFHFFEFTQDGSYVLDFEPEVQFVPGASLNKTGGPSLAIDDLDDLYFVSRELGIGQSDGGEVQKLSLAGRFVGLPAVNGPDREFVDLAVDPASHDLYVILNSGKVQHFLGSCAFTHEVCTPFDTFGIGQLNAAMAVTVDGSSGIVYVADTGDQRISVFTPVPYFPDLTASATALSQTTERFDGSIDPAAAGPLAACHFEYGPGEGEYNVGSVPCTPASTTTDTQVTAEATSGFTYGTTYHYRLQVENPNGLSSSYDQIFTTLPQAPKIVSEAASDVHADAALVRAQLNPGGGEAAYHTTYRIEYVDDEEFQQSGFEQAGESPSADAGSAKIPTDVTAHLSALAPGTTYHYRVLATNECEVSKECTTEGQTHTFTTLPSSVDLDDPCPNAHVRQQTGAAGLLDCRAYELVSAASSGSYDVESDLIEGQIPYGAYREAEGRVLYGIHGGGIPGTDHPTNRGLDPYLATRGSGGWSTEYVGVPADDPFAAGPFSSTPSGADANLETFAFAAPGGCSPCFAGGYTGIPVRMPNGELAQGMAGPENPGPTAKVDGHVAKDLSADGKHLIFASTSLFAPGGNPDTGDVSIYDRNLKSGQTHVVSNQPGTEDLPQALKCLQGDGQCSSATSDANGISELDISSDGSHILIGQKVAEDSEGNPYWHLYMDVGDGVNSIDLTPGAADGVLYDGMTSDGSKVFFSSEDALTNDDQDQSTDIYEAEASGTTATLTRISTGSEGALGNTDSCDPLGNSAHEPWNTVGSEPSCDAVAIGGGAGVASGEGSIYFLSPERLAGSSHGVQDAPNLYLARPGSAPRFVTTLESSLNGPQPPQLRHTYASSFGSFIGATGIAVDHSSGDVYVLDAAANTVQKFDSSGNLITSFGDTTPTPDGHLAGLNTQAGTFSERIFGFIPVTQLAVDQATGDLYVPDGEHGVIDKFSSSGELLTEIKEVSSPTGVSVDPLNGDVYVSKLFGGVDIFGPSGNPLPSLPIEGLLTSVAVDSAGTVYVTLFGEKTAAFDSAGNFVRTLDSSPPESVAVDPANGDAYVDEGSRLVRFDASGHQIETLSPAPLTGSVGIAIDPGGPLLATSAGGVEVASFAATLAPSPLIDNQLVIDSVSDPSARHTADFQTTPDGAFAAFPSTLALAGREEETAGHTVLYRYAAVDEKLDCVSCTTTGAPSAANSSLASDGFSLTDSGRVFFDSADQLAAADTDGRKDAYEWEPQGAGDCQRGGRGYVKATDACLALISAGTSTFDSGLLGVGADGKDAYFFTRDSLAPQDKNGATMKIYDARVEGGFPYGFPAVGCKASDECHGAASPAPPPVEIRSLAATSYGESHHPCKKGYIRRHGKCARKHRPHKHHKRGNHHRGGSK